MNVANPWIGTVGWALVHFLWQGVLIWIGVSLSLRLLRQAKPTARYAVACAGLLLCLALPVSGIIRNLPNVVSSHEQQTDSNLSSFETDQLEPNVSTLNEKSLTRILDTHLGLIVMVWSVGACLLSLRFASGLVWVRKLRLSEALPDGDPWKMRLADLSRALGLKRSVVMKVVGGIEGPVAAGLWRPAIFIPLSVLTGMAPELVEALLAHELAHIKRHDYLVNLVQSAIEVILFYHPAVWWISNRIRIEREQICDDLAARALGEPRRLALALQELDLLQLRIPHLAQAAHGGNLMSRIRRLIHPEPRTLAWKAMISILGITAACVASAAISSSRLQDVPKPPPLQAPAEPPLPLPPPPPQDPADAPLPVPPPPPAPPEPPRPSKSDLTYAFVRQGGKISCSGSGNYIDEVKALRKKHNTNFFCFREKGQFYVIDDPTEMAKVQALFQPMEALGKQMDELGKEMKGHGEKMKTLGREMNSVTKQSNPRSEEMKELSKQMGTIGRKMGALYQRRGVLERKRDHQKLSNANQQRIDQQVLDLNQQIEAAESKMKALGKDMEAQGHQIEQAHKPMEAIGQRMTEAGKPMEEIGKRMEAVGTQMEKENQKVEEGLKRLIQQALATNKARNA